MNAYPAVLVVPASVKWNWHREAEKWIPGKRTIVLKGTKAKEEIRAYDFLILNYDILHAWIEKIRDAKPRTVVFDEIQMVKDKRSRRSKAAKILAGGITYILGLSGTPILNRPIELAHPLDILRRLEEFGGWWRFATRYAAAHRTRFGLDTSGASNLDELSTKLRQVCMVRRQKRDVLQELPPKTISIIETDLENQKEYDSAEADVIRFLGQRAAKDAAFLASIAGLDTETQAAMTRQHRSSAEEKAARAEALVKIGTLKQIAARGKLTAIKEWIGNFLDSGEKLVVFAWHQAIQNAILEANPGAARIVADDDSEERQANVDRFQKDPSCRLIVCSILAGGVGITLTAASDVLMVELPWNPATFDQCTDRLHRIGQQGSVTCWTMLGKGSIDMDIWDLILRKRKVVDAATEGAGAVAQESMLKELVEKLIRKGKP